MCHLIIDHKSLGDNSLETSHVITAYNLRRSGQEVRVCNVRTRFSSYIDRIHDRRILSRTERIGAIY